MRILIQVVDKASVKIDNKTISSINKGYLLLVSFNNEDNYEIIDKMVEKLCKTRLFCDENGKTNLSIFDINGEILSVSQFTLYGSLKKTNRPSFVNAAKPEYANELYEYFLKKCEEYDVHVEHGVFGAHMEVSLLNDGPVTIELEK